MEHSEKIIPITFNRRDFEAIFFRNRQGHFLLSPVLKSQAIWFFLFFILLIVITPFALLTNKSSMLVLLFFVLTIGNFIPYYFKLLKLFEWRKEVRTYLDHNEKFRSHQLRINESYFAVLLDDEEYITKWSALSKVAIKDSYVTLEGTHFYCIPKSCMKPADYNYFLQAIKKHLISEEAQG